MSTNWFTSDTHAWHQNIIRYNNRPWSTAHQMTEALADNINACVQANDTLFHLGDFSWGHKLRAEGFRSMINCKHVVLVLGNHDQLIADEDNVDLHRLFHQVGQIVELNLRNRHKIVMCHYSMRVWNASFHGSWHLHGHSHGTLTEDPTSLSFDVGVDCWDYKPVSIDQVREKMEGKLNAP